MFDQVIVELMKMDQKNIYRETELSQLTMKSVQFKLPFMSRVYATLGDALIRTGLKFKKYSRAKLNTETAQAPNYMIML